MRTHWIRNEKGSVLVMISLLMAAAVLLSCGLVYNVVTSDDLAQRPNIRRANAKMGAKLIHDNILALLRDSSIWSETVSLNPSLHCFESHTNCPGAHSYKDLNKVGIASTLFFDSTAPNFGFSITGEPCSSFNDAADDVCIFRPSIQWQPVCAGHPCIDPPVQLKVVLVIKDSFLASTPMNTADLSFEEFK